MKRLSFATLSLVAALAACKAEPTAGEQPPGSTTPAAAELIDLSASTEAVRAEFNAKQSAPRLLTLLSPTCGACLHGARAVKQTIVDNAATRSLSEIVVWIPMLADDSRGAAREASQLFRDAEVSQFWDGRQHLGKEVGRSVGVPDWIAWDIYLFYAPGVQWLPGALPTPAAALAQAGGVVVATKGTLPPLPDQARLPKDLLGKADVVGEQSNLEALLTSVAETFARRNSKP
jgi:hypothetical protein